MAGTGVDFFAAVLVVTAVVLLAAEERGGLSPVPGMGVMTTLPLTTLPSSTTSTVSTTTLCYFTNAAIAACKRKRRAFADEDSLSDVMITPSLVTE